MGLDPHARPQPKRTLDKAGRIPSPAFSLPRRPHVCDKSLLARLHFALLNLLLGAHVIRDPLWHGLHVRFPGPSQLPDRRVRDFRGVSQRRCFLLAVPAGDGAAAGYGAHVPPSGNRGRVFPVGSDESDHDAYAVYLLVAGGEDSQGKQVLFVAEGAEGGDGEEDRGAETEEDGSD